MSPQHTNAEVESHLPEWNAPTIPGRFDPRANPLITSDCSVFHKTTFAWLSDLHLECLHTCGVVELHNELRNAQVDLLLVTGDISSSFHIAENLTALASLGKPLYFTTGNHEYHGSSIESVDAHIARTCRNTKGLTRLGFGEIVRLSRESVLIGHGGWGDGRAGLGSKSTFKMLDAEVVEDFKRLSRAHLFHKLRSLGDQTARYFEKLLPVAAKEADTIYVATHVPPFKQSAQHGNQDSSPAALPFFVNESLGKVLLRFAHKHPKKRIVVLCGHTHTLCRYQPAANLLVKVAGVRLGFPKIQEIWTA